MYGYTTYPASPSTSRNVLSGGIQDNISVRNYASIKQKRKNTFKGGEITFDQKYERVASLVTKSNKYEQDEKKLRKEIQNYKALIQYEKRSGLQGHRQLVLAIGVDPLKFDKL